MATQHDIKPLPFFFVGKEITSKRKAGYAAQKLPLLTQALGKPDTRSVWYSKEHIAKLLAEIEYAGGDGMRISFGMYEDGHAYAGQTCLLMNSTRAKQAGDRISHVDVLIEDEPNFSERSSLPRDIIAFPGESAVFARPKDYNFGSPCPPICD
jgi:hypothetical protein